METFPRPPVVARQQMTLLEFTSREAQLRRTRDFEAKPAVAVSCQAPNDARLAPGPALACALPNGRLIKTKARNGTRFILVGRMRSSDNEHDLEDISVQASHAPADPPEHDGARRYLGFEAVDTRPEAPPPAALTDLLTNAEMRQYFPNVPVTEKYSTAEIERIVEVLVDATGRKDVVVLWNDTVPAARKTTVRAEQVRGGAARINRFLAARERARTDTAFYNCQPTGKTRVDAAGQTEIEVRWDVDRSFGWTRESLFL
jgi:hypothetical protein